MDSQLPLNNNFQDLLAYLEARNPILSPILSPIFSASPENFENFKNFENFDNIFKDLLNSLDNIIPSIINPSTINPSTITLLTPISILDPINIEKSKKKK